MLACSRGGGGVSVKTCVLYTSQLRGHAAQGGEAAMWPPGSPTQSLNGCGREPGWMQTGAWEDVDGSLDGYGWGPGWMRTGAWEDVDGRLGRYGLGPGCCEQLPLFSHKLRLTCAWSLPWSVVPGSQHPSHQVLHLGRRTLVFVCLHTLGLTHQHPGLLLVFSPYTDST